MGVSIIDIQRDLIVETLKATTRGDWKVLVVDPTTKKLLFNVLKEDDILNQNITNIEEIDQKRPVNPDMDAIYMITPEPWIVDCLIADFERRRYKGTFLIWTSLPRPPLQERIDRSPLAKQQIRMFRVINADYYPRESHLVTFRDPWSFPILFHPDCNNLVRMHMEDIAQKIVAVCVSLEENPIVRYYKPRTASHEASVLCTHLARFVQEQLDMYVQYHPGFPPQTSRPRGTLYITDRSMDLFAPLLHEFTYQAMAFDLLKINDGDRVSYRTIINEGQPDAEEKEIDITEKDKIWVDNRHRHMKDTIEKLMGDFQRFIQENGHFTNSGDASSLNAIKDMLAGLPQFQEMKEAYSLHLSMAQESMNIFQEHKLPDIASIEQSLATGLDEDYRKPKNLADQVVRTLDEEAVTLPDRLRLIALYILYKHGLLQADVVKLLAHAQLPPQDGDALGNLELLGARVYKALKDTATAPPPPFPYSKLNPNVNEEEEYSLSRFISGVKSLLEEHVKGTLDPITFPFTKPELAAESIALAQETASSASLRSAKPTWAKGRLGAVEPRQRVIVLMAGGATYSEARACYEVSQASSRDIFLVTSHMMTPGLFMRQVGDLSTDKRRLNIPAEQPPKKAPAHLFEREAPAPVPPPASAKPMPGGLPSRPGGLPSGPRRGDGPPVAAMGNMSLNPGVGAPRPPQSPIPLSSSPAPSSGKLSKEEKKEKKEKKHKHHFFSSKK